MRILRLIKTIYPCCLVSFLTLVVLALGAAGPGALWAQSQTAGTEASSDNKADSEMERESLYQEALVLAMDKMFAELEALEKTPGLPQDVKKQKAIEFVNVVRWGPDKRNNFWINDLQGKMIMDPYIPDLNGKDLMNFTDRDGTEVFREAIQISRQDGQGFIDYVWPKYETDRLAEKVSLVRLHKRWNWVIGTGVFGEDLDEFELWAASVMTQVSAAVEGTVEGIRFYMPQETIGFVDDRAPASSVGSD